MLIGGNRLLDASFRLRWLTVGAVIVATAMVGVSVSVPLVIAQDPPEGYVPEPGYLDGPGDFGYPRSDDEVAGEQVDCTIDPGNSRCPIPPPHSISRPTATFTATAANLSVAYQRVVWALQSSHYYMFELHRSKRASSGFTKSADDWDEETPVLFNNVAVGYYYKVRAKRCRVPERESTCGAWGKFSSTLYVPEVATGLSFTLTGRTLTTSYTASGSSYDEIEVAERSIGSSGNGESDKDNISGSGHREPGTEGNEYRFRVRRCTDRDRDNCGSWSAWSDWKPVPALASRLSVSLTDGTVSAIYSASGASTEDQIKVESRVGGSTTTGDPENITGSGHSWGGLSGTAYRFQVRRCLDTGRKECGRWSAWSPWKSVPVTATNPSLSLSDGTLTATYSPTSRSKDVIETENRSSGSSRSGAKSQANAEGSGHRLTGLGGRDHRFRVKRCSADNRDVRYDCGNWSEWSPWKSVPATASNPSLSLTDGTLTATYSPTSSSKDVIETENRSSGSSRSGAKSQANSEGSGHRLTGSGGREYRFRVKRCSADDRNVRYDCGYWSAWSSWKSVPVTATNPSLSLDYGELTARYSPTGESDDVIEVENRSIGSSSSGSKSQANSDGSGHDWDASGGREYRFRVKRCSADNRNVRYDCGNWSVWSSWQEVPASPTGLSQSRSGATLTFTYSGGSYNVIDVDRRLIGDDEVDDYRTLNRDSGYSRTVDRGYDYQFRASRCTSRSRSACGPWSSPTDWLRFPRLPDPPSDLVLKRSRDDLTLEYDRSSWSDGSGHYYEFELRQSETERGTFDEEDTKDDTRSPLSFRNVDRGYWYQVFGRRCTDSGRKDCPDWPTTGSNKVEVPVLPGKPAKPSLTVSEDDLTVVYTAVTGTYPKFNFASNETKSGRYDAYAGGTLVGAKLSSVATGKWYKVTLQLCTDDGLTDCSVESDESEAAGVPHGKPGTPSLTVSDDDLTVVYTTIAGTHDQFDFESSPSSGGTYKDYTGGTLSGTKRSDVAMGAWYKVRVRRCLDSGHIVCSEWSEYSSAVVVLPKTPGKPTLTVSEDDLTVSYTVDDGFTSKDDYEFTTNDEESGNYTVYTGGTPSGAKLEGVATGMWYKVRVRRCLETTHVNCSAWSVYSDAKEVPEVSRFPALVAPTIGSGADGVSVLASFTLVSGYDYELELQSSGNQKDYVYASSVKPKSTDSSHTFTGLSDVSTRSFQARVRACVTGSITDCGDWIPGNVITVSKAPAPTVTGITVANEDDLTIAYTIPDWQHGTGTVYDFKIRRADTSSGPFTSDYTGGTTPSGQPHKFNDVHTGYYYRALSRRCSDTAKSICGDWSRVQSGVDVPALTGVPAPTNIRVLAGQAKVIASFSNSTWAGKSNHHYTFELGKSSTETGSYVYGAPPTTQEAGKVSFTSIEIGKWYKVRGKRCHTSAGMRCGAWSESLRAQQSLVPNPRVEIVELSNSITIGQGFSHNLIAVAKGLDPTESYSIVYTSSTQGTQGKVLKFKGCHAFQPSQTESTVGPGVRSSGSVTQTLLACAPGTDSLVVSVRHGTRNIALDSVTVTVTELPIPTDVRANGNSPHDAGQVELRWTKAKRVTGHQYIIALADNENHVPIPTSELEWSAETVMPTNGIVSGLSLKRLYAVRVSAVRPHFDTDWSEIVYAFPTYRQPQNGDSSIWVKGKYDNTPRVANLYLAQFHPGHEVMFTVCADTFPQAKRSAWVADVQEGIASWVNAVRWRDPVDGGYNANIIRVRHSVSYDCQTTGATTGLTKSVVTLERDRHEFRRYCGQLIAIRGRSLMRDPAACASNFRHPEFGMVSLIPWGSTFQPSIRFNGNLPDYVTIKEWTPGSTKERSDRACSNVSLVAAHEAGHSIGLGHTPGDVEEKAVMVNGQTKYCGPQPFDVAALMAIYQSPTEP